MKVFGELRWIEPVDDIVSNQLMTKLFSADVSETARSFVYARMDSGEVKEGQVLGIGGHRVEILLYADSADLLTEDSRHLKCFVSDLDPELRGELLTEPYAKIRGARITIWGDEDVH